MNKIFGNLFLILILLFALACKKESEKISSISVLPKKIIKSNKDSIVNFILNVKDKSIFNNTDKEIYVLINGEREYLEINNKTSFHYSTECLKCQSIEIFGNKLLFAKQLLISENNIKYFKTPIVISEKLKQIETERLFEQKIIKFKFKAGIGKIKFEKVACNDSDLNEITLNYGKQKIIIRNFIEANFFEYDLDENGTNEQYIFGARNCSQEVVILRIRETSKK